MYDNWPRTNWPLTNPNPNVGSQLVQGQFVAVSKLSWFKNFLLFLKEQFVLQVSQNNTFTT